MADTNRERWKRLVADFEWCDLTQREFAAERGLSFHHLRYWIYRLRKEGRPLVAAAPSASGQAPVRRSSKTPLPGGAAAAPSRRAVAT